MPLKKNSNQNLTSVNSNISPKNQDSDTLIISELASTNIQIYLPVSKTVKFLSLIVVALTLVSIIIQFTLHYLPYYPSREALVRLFNVDGEANIPAVYSTATLLFCAILLAIIAHAKKVVGNRFSRHWKALSIIFVFLSLDELVSLHEELINPMRSLFHTSGFLYFAWVIPGGIFVIICLLTFMQFLAALPKTTRRLFFLAGGIFIAGTLGVEMVGAYYSNLYGQENFVYAIVSTVEELFEMLGVIVFISALMSYINLYVKEVGLRVRFSDRQVVRSLNLQ